MIEYLSELNKECSGMEPRQLNPLTLAYLGDVVYELAVRTLVVRRGEASPSKMNKETVGLVRAETQSAMAEKLLPSFTEEEADVYRRGRNAHSHTHARHASLADYHRATGLEAVFGYLYLKGENGRILELLEAGMTEHGPVKTGMDGDPAKRG